MLRRTILASCSKARQLQQASAWGAQQTPDAWKLSASQVCSLSAPSSSLQQRPFWDFARSAFSATASASPAGKPISGSPNSRPASSSAQGKQAFPGSTGPPEDKAEAPSRAKAEEEPAAAEAAQSSSGPTQRVDPETAAEAGAGAPPLVGDIAEMEQQLQELRKDFNSLDKAWTERQKEIDELKDKLVRAYADMENLRTRSARQAENSQKFALQGFVKSLLEVVDNLERAAHSLSDDELAGRGKDGADMDREKLLACLRNLQEGVQLTERILLNNLKSNGVELYKPLGDKFDPNLHNALFQMEDAERESGTIGVVTKAGCSLNGRVVRPAEVGVVRARQ